MKDLKMKTMRTHILFNFLAAVVVLLLFTTCGKEDFNERTNYQILIGEYFEQNPEQFSTFVTVLERSGSLSFLKAYGTYTCFAPTNEAFEKFFTQENKQLADFTDEELRDLVKYHILASIIPSTDFVDGRLSELNNYGQYMTTRTYLENGRAVFKLNKYAVVRNVDNMMLNGVIHVMDDVIKPVELTIAQQLEADPSFSIFTRALKETTLFDTLNVRLTDEDFVYDDEGNLVNYPRWFTVMAVPNTAFEKSGITSYEQLKERYSDTGNPSNPLDSLYLHMAYHFLDSNMMYVSDFAATTTTAGYFTKAPLEVITIKNKGQDILVNEDEYLGFVEEGFAIDRDISDNTSNNGVFHIMEEDFFIKVRFPTAVYWDVTDQFEIKKIPGVYRKESVTLESGQLEDIQWEPESRTIKYKGAAGDYFGNVLGDRLEVYLRPEVVKSIQFRSPIIVKGTYKIWICTRNQYSSAGHRKPIFFVYMDDEKLPIIIDNWQTLNNTESDGELELRGYKRYAYHPSDSLEQNYTSRDRASRYVGQLAGTIELKATGRHWIKFVAISAYAGAELWLDQIQIIPAEMDQVWPKPNIEDGSLVYKEDLPEQGTFE